MSELGRELGRLLRESIQGLKEERRKTKSTSHKTERITSYLGSKGPRRYLVFCGTFYYPEGGWNDFYKDTDSLDEAIRYCEHYIKKEAPQGYGWCHIVDIYEGRIIRRFESEE